MRFIRSILKFIFEYLPLPFRLKIDFDLIPYPYYAFCILRAAVQAKKIGLSAISVIEFGVAAGQGLCYMQKYARIVSKITNIDISVFGFDSGVGLPKPSDRQDLPYHWTEGDYKMDVTILKKKLDSKTTLILGDVKETVLTFFEKYHPAPIGFIAFDFDYYSSTRDALNIFKTTSENFLPRIIAFFDDILGNGDTLMNDFVGELLAVNEYNSENNYKLGKVCGFRHSRIIKRPWNDCIFSMHRFDHSRYHMNIN